MTLITDRKSGHVAKGDMPVVFLSGMLADHRMWDRAIAAYDRLEGIKRPAIAPIHRNLFDQDCVGDMARAVLASAPDRFALVGMSMGGYVAFEILRQAPERVSHLMLVNTRATADSKAVKRRRILLARIAGQHQPFVGINDALLDEMIHPANRGDRALIGLLADMAEAAGADVFRRQSRAVAHRPDSLELLGNIAVPCCVLSGEADRVISPASHADMACRIKEAAYQDVRGAAHYVPLEQPDVFARALARLLGR